MGDAHNDDRSGVLDLAKSALSELVLHEPQRHPLIIAIVSPLGTPAESVVRALEASLARFDYKSKEISMSALLDDFPSELVGGPLPQRGENGYYTRRMNAGDMLRGSFGSGSALAAKAIARIAEEREREVNGIAFVLRTLKHPDEEALLRHIYGDAFSLLGVSCSADERRQTLVDALSTFTDPRSEAEGLIARDEADPDGNPFGQHVRALFERGDAYLPVRRGFDVRPEVDRFIDSVFGAPFVTPRPEEEAMKIAANASLRSASLGRQVGAALIPRIGTPVVVGTNEVPKPGGGQYWTEDSPDHRDFQSGVDPNPVYMRRAIQEILSRLAKHNWLTDEYRERSDEELWELANRLDDRGESVLRGARLSALIEFNRCVHAEQAAIINAARSGVSTQDARLFTITFPCHECTKMIIGAGIVEVVYIEPYPKSLADRLFRDLIDTEPPLNADAELVGGRVPFRPFQGIAPRRYEAAFSAGKRKVGEEAVVLSRTATPKSGAWLESAVHEQEGLALGDAVAREAQKVAAEVVTRAGISVEIIVFDREGQMRGRSL